MTPSILRKDLLAECHGTLVGGVIKTLAKLQQQYFCREWHRP